MSLNVWPKQISTVIGMTPLGVRYVHLAVDKDKNDVSICCINVKNTAKMSLQKFTVSLQNTLLNLCRLKCQIWFSVAYK